MARHLQEAGGASIRDVEFLVRELLICSRYVHELYLGLKGIASSREVIIARDEAFRVEAVVAAIVHGGC